MTFFNAQFARVNELLVVNLIFWIVTNPKLTINEFYIIKPLILNEVVSWINIPVVDNPVKDVFNSDTV